MIQEAFNKIREAIVKPSTLENEYKPNKFVCVKKTVYPEDKPRLNKDGSEWYGLTKEKFVDIK